MRLNNDLGFSLFEVSIALLLIALIVVISGQAHSSWFSILQSQGRTKSEHHQEAWTTSDVSARNCEREVTDSDSKLLHCKKNNQKGKRKVKTLALE